MITMLESLNYSFRNPKNIIWVIYRIKQLRNYKKNHGVLRGPQLGILRYKCGMLLFLLFLGSKRCKFEKWPANNAQKMTLFRCWMSDAWVWKSSVPPVTTVEISIKYLMLTMLESLNYSFRNPKKHNLSNLLHQTIEKLPKKPWGPPRTPAW